MTNSSNIQDSPDFSDLRKLHPDYTDLELQQSHDQLYAYFDLAWSIFTRIEREEPEHFERPIQELQVAKKERDRKDKPTQASV